MGSHSFVGAWRLVTFEFRKADGNVIYPFGAEAQGTIIYTESGRYSAQLMRKGRPRLKSGDQMKGTVEEVQASFKGCISYFGKYEIDHEKGIIVHHVEGSLFPNMEGTNQPKTIFRIIEKLFATTDPTHTVGWRKSHWHSAMGKNWIT